jgi:thioredoxin-like negative regulator of GroEL
MSLIEITTRISGTVVEGADQPVLVLFTAPCADTADASSPLSDALPKATPDELLVGMVNVDDNEPLEDRFES